MSDCCPTSCTQAEFPKRHACPANGKAYGLVSPATIRHHIKTPWQWQVRDQSYYFCSDPDCPVVYFGQDDSVIEKHELRTQVGVKEKSDDALVCYCYGVTKSEAKRNPLARQFVMQQTKQGQCACESRNPSGKCCLADFPK